MRGVAGRVIGNTLWLVLQRIGSRLLIFLCMIYLARGLGSVAFGKFIFANSFTLLFVTLSDVGITSLTIREVARHKERGPEYVGGFATLKICLSILAFVVIAVSIAFMNMPADTRVAAYLIGGSMLFRNMAGFFGAIFQAYEEMKYVTITEIGQRCLLLSLCLLLLYQGYGLISIGLAYLFSGVFHCFLNLGLVYERFLKPQYRIDPQFWREALKEAFPLAFVAVISMVYYNIDIVMLGKMKGEEVAGWYGASYHLFFALATLTGAFLTAVFPVMSRFFEESDELLNKAYRKSFEVMIGAGIPISIGGFLLSEKIIFFLFGPQYHESVAILKIFSLLIMFSYLNGLAGYFLTSINRQGLTAKILAATAGINVALNFLLIPSYSYMGAAYATVVSEVLFFIFFFVFLPGRFRYLPGAKIGKSMISSAIMGVLIIFMIKNGLTLPSIIVVGAIIYSICVWVTGYITRDEKAELQKIFQGKSAQ